MSYRTLLVSFGIVCVTATAQDEEAVVKKETIYIHTVEHGTMPLFSAASGSVTSVLPSRAVLAFEEGQQARCDTGRSVRVLIDTQKLAGTVVREVAERPSGSNCEIAISDPLPSTTEVGKNVRALVEVGEVRDVVYFGRPADASPDSSAMIFVVDPTSSFARRTTVRYGKVSGPFVQVLEGLAPGDRVIVTDMSKWSKHPQVRLN